MDGVICCINYFANDEFRLKTDVCECGGTHCVYNTQAARISRVHNPGLQSIFCFVMDGSPLVPPLMPSTRGMMDADEYAKLQRLYQSKHFARPDKMVAAGHRRRRNSSPVSAAQAFLFCV